MKLNGQDSKPQGSFGIPDNIKEAADKHKARAEMKAKPAPVETGEEHEEKAKPDEQKVKTPYDILKGMGADFKEEDFQKLIFKGTYEAVIDIVKSRLNAKFRTVTTGEHDEIDEIIAKEMKDIDMTQDGLRSRQSLLVISYGVTELQGKPLVKAIKKEDGSLDTKAMALARRAVFLGMAPSVVNILINRHGAITVAINMITADPEESLKNS